MGHLLWTPWVWLVCSLGFSHLRVTANQWPHHFYMQPLTLVMPWQGKTTGLLFVVLETGSYGVAQDILLLQPPGCCDYRLCTTLPGKMASFSASKNVQKGVIGRTEKGDGKTNYVFTLTTTNNYWQMFTISTVLANVYHIHGGPPISLLLTNNYQWLISFCLVSSHCSSVLKSERSVVFFFY